MKGSKLFALTINNVDWGKDTTGFWFRQDSIFNGICVAEEEYHPPLDCVTGQPSNEPIRWHHHVFLETCESVLLDYVRDVVLTLTDDVGFDLQVCRSRKSWLLYITKTDASPFLFNVRVSELSLFCRAQQHIRTKYRKPGKVDNSDDFMASVGNFRNLCVDMAEKHMDILRKEVQDRRLVYPPNMFCGYCRRLEDVLNAQQHVYLFGVPGIGKSELVDVLTFGKRVWRAGSNDRFMFGSLPEDCEVAIFEDFKDDMEMLPTLLSIMDHKPVSISQKYKDDSTKMFFCVCVFISNFEITMSMFSRRVCRFYLEEHKIYTCKGCAGF